MKAAFKISILLNVLLAGCLIYLLAQKRNAAPTSSNIPAPITLTSNPPLRAEPKPFRWSQIESPDYLTYIKNLRSVGCPEQTIRDLIVADVGQLYEGRAQRLKQDQSLFKDALAAQLRALDDEKAKVIAYLLGNKPAATSLADLTNDNRELHADSLPLVWQKADLAKLNLEPAQLEAIAGLRQAFLDRIAGLDPKSAPYREQWEKAQPEIDDALAGTIGRKAFLDYESAAKINSTP